MALKQYTLAQRCIFQNNKLHCSENQTHERLDQEAQLLLE